MKLNGFNIKKVGDIWLFDTLRRLPDRQRKRFRTKEEAVAYAEEVRKRIEEYGLKSVLSPLQQADAALALQTLAKDHCKVSLNSAAEFYVKHNGTTNKTCSEVYAEILTKMKADKSLKQDEYVRKNPSTMKQFLELHGDRNIATVSSLEIEDFLETVRPINDPEGFLSKSGILERFRSIRKMFRYAKKKKYISLNPMEAVEAPTEDMHHPTILTVEQAQSLVDHAKTPEYRYFLPYVCFALYCGVRSRELQRLKWSNVKWDENVVSLTYDITKKPRTRNIPIPLNVQKLLLRWSDGMDTEGKYVLDIPREGIQRSDARKDGACNFSQRWKKFTKSAGFKVWPSNCMRHSFASYLLKTSGENTTLVQDRMGHTKTRVLFSHYIACTPSRDDSLDYFMVGLDKSDIDLKKYKGDSVYIKEWEQVLRALNLAR